MNYASHFKRNFSPYTGKHIYQKQSPNLFGPGVLFEWRTIEQPLTASKINRAIEGTVTLGYFLSVCADCFCLDIDDHTGKGGGYLLSIYENICRKVGIPSLLCKTPHGMHAFYFLSHPVPEPLLIGQVRRLLRDVPVEVKPTNAIGLRIPTEKGLLDPLTLKPLNKLFDEAVNAAMVYHPAEVFGMGIMPHAIIEGLKERQSKAVKVRTWRKIGKVEEEYGKYGIQAGETNTALCELVPVYRSAGFTPEETAAEFIALLAQEYDGELRKYRRLLQRIQSFYKNEPESRFNALPQKYEGGLFTEVIAEAIAALVIGPTETRQQKSALTMRRRTAQKAVTVIESWRLYLDDVITSKQSLEMWNYLYPYFTKNTSEGFYPISRNIFKKKMHEHYESWLLPFLLEIGYLERSPYPYSSVYGICYYYRINGEKFFTDTPKPESKPKRISKAQARAEQIRAYKQEHPKMSNVAIAKILGVNEITVRRALKGC
ncbi:hypothetical protein FACS1894172_08300 [Spirochaetia bacterium]|nr:hypothetical protein FACS1894164_07900 [Spirochaetia bacterium]GHU32160.1 hypothetical protein FACS1894172_08300 [Spirochaetia bacterium]